MGVLFNFFYKVQRNIAILQYEVHVFIKFAALILKFTCYLMS